MAATTEKQFFTQKPVDQVPYTTLEFHHPDIGTLRYVTNQQLDKQFHLEIGAPRNANQVVTFEAVAFEAPEPEQGENGDVSLNIALGGVGQMVKEKNKLITEAGERDPLEVIWRRHLSGVTYPVRTIYLQARSLTLRGLAVGYQAERVNPFGRRVGQLRTSERYAGLAGFI